MVEDEAVASLPATAAMMNEGHTEAGPGSKVREGQGKIVGMAGIAKSRLAEERRAWRKDHPIGFFARPETSPDGSVNLMRWKCGVPGKEKGIWAGGLYDITMEFTEDYPHTPPKCKFPAGFFHPNVYPSGTVCLSILNAEEAWKPGITLKQILLGIQDLLDTPNPQSPAQQNAYIAYTSDRATYDKRVKEQVAQNRPDRYE